MSEQGPIRIVVQLDCYDDVLVGPADGEGVL